MRTRWTLYVLWLFQVGFLCALMASARGAEVMVFAAASLKESLQAVGADYERCSTNRIRFNFAASSLLARQIGEGAPADVFFSADEASMNLLDQQGCLVPGTRRDVLGNSLVVVVPSGSMLKINSARDLAGPKVGRLVLADPAAVPAGVYARKWLEMEGAWKQIQGRVVPAENVRAALAAVASGNMDAGVVYSTDAAISRRVKVVYTVPVGKSPQIRYPAALVKGGFSEVAARSFLNYLCATTAMGEFRRRGFLMNP